MVKWQHHSFSFTSHPPNHLDWSTAGISIVSKVSKGDNVVVRSADFYFSNIINSKCTLALYLYSNRKKGKQANNERDRERESASVGALRKNELGIPHKTNRWEKTQLTSFWDKPWRISNFWETILMEEGIEKIHKDKTFSHKTLETIGTTTCHTFSIFTINSKLIIRQQTKLTVQDKWIFILYVHEFRIKMTTVITRLGHNNECSKFECSFGEYNIRDFKPIA